MKYKIEIGLFVFHSMTLRSFQMTVGIVNLQDRDMQETISKLTLLQDLLFILFTLKT